MEKFECRKGQKSDISEEELSLTSQTSSQLELVWQAHSFEVETDSRKYKQYQRGGLVVQSKEPKILQFQTFAEALKHPGDFLISDFAKMDRPPVLHIAFQALDAFQVFLLLHLHHSLADIEPLIFCLNTK